ncbi:MAG: hypothetical protein ABJQ34_15730 [Paracoccaceae bacterium]
MKRVKIGDMSFDVAMIPYVPSNLATSDFMFDNFVSGVHKTKEMTWDCEEGVRNPQPYDSKFKNIEPNLLIYDTPGPFSPKLHSEVERLSVEFAHWLIAKTGFASGDALNEALKQQFGIHSPSFDVDAAINDWKPRYRMKISVSLNFMQFELRNPKLLGHRRLVLSLPDRVRILVQRTHECAEDGVRRLDGAEFFSWNHREFPVRAATANAFKLRRTRKLEELQEAQEALERAREQVRKLREDMEKIKPEEGD